MRLMISGVTGFVGQNLLNYLNNEIEYLAITREQLQEPVIPSDITAIIHLAGKAHDLKKVSNPGEYYTVNFELTKKLYDAFLKSNAKIFIFISSIKAIADEVNGILTEEAIPKPKTAYGKSKLVAENYIQNQQLPAGKSYYILRPCMIHGPGNKGNLNLLYQFVKKGIPYPLAAFKNKRSFLSIENLCFIIKEIITRNDIAGGVYQVADDEPLSTTDVVSILGASLNKTPKLLNVNTGFIKVLARIGDLLHLPLTTERLNKLTESYIISNNKIKNTVNRQLPLTAKEGLKLTADSFNKV